MVIYLDDASKGTGTFYYDAVYGKIVSNASSISVGYNNAAKPEGSSLTKAKTGIIKIDVDTKGNITESWVLLSDVKSGSESSNNKSSSSQATASASSSQSTSLATITYENLKVETDSIGKTYAYPLIEVTNTSSSDVYINISQIDIEDASGKIVATNDMVSTTLKILKPNEKAYTFCSTGFAMPDGTDASAVYKMVPNAKCKKATSEDVRYDVSQTELSKGSFGGFEIVGRVTNNTKKDDSYCYLTYVLFGADGNPIGAGGTSVTDLNAGSTIGFKASSLMMPEEVTIDSIANFTVFAEKEVYEY